MTDKDTGRLAFLMNNKGTKLASVLLALVVWYAIQTVISHEAVVTDVPLSIELDEGWAILDRSAKSVDILFRGSQEDVRYLNREQIQVVVDLRGHTHGGAMTVRLGPRNVRAPGAVRPIAVRPDEVSLKLDPEAEKQIVVKAELQGSPPEGFEVEKVVCTPASVALTGSRQRLGDVENVRTAPIDLEGRSRTFKKLKMNVLQPSDTWVARISPSNVVVEVSIVERSATRDVDDIPVSVLLRPGPRPKVEAWPGKVSITLKGRAELLKNMELAEVQAYVDCTSLQGGASYELPVNIHLPQGMTAVTVTPTTVKVTLGESL